MRVESPDIGYVVTLAQRSGLMRFGVIGSMLLKTAVRHGLRMVPIALVVVSVGRPDGDEYAFNVEQIRPAVGIT